MDACMLPIAPRSKNSIKPERKMKNYNSKLIMMTQAFLNSCIIKDSSSLHILIQGA